mmetsp:Transcript_38536/g.66581  ORF Transcript_38536/g.66581 Transcript_38536/m.66581 type:complete len:405 (-) Transcript_38536:2285-3499(-)
MLVRVRSIIILPNLESGVLRHPALGVPTHEKFAHFVPDDQQGDDPNGHTAVQTVSLHQESIPGGVDEDANHTNLKGHGVKHRVVVEEAAPGQDGGDLGLADHSVGHLRPHNGHQIRTLGVGQRLHQVVHEVLLAVTAGGHVVRVVEAHLAEEVLAVVREFIPVHAVLQAGVEQRVNGEAVVVVDPEEREERCEALHHADGAVRDEHELRAHQVSVLVTRRVLHDGILRLLVGEGHGRSQIGTQIHDQDGDGGDTEGNLDRDEKQERNDFGHVRGQHVGHALLEVLENQTSLADTIDDGAEVIVQQDQLGSLLGDGSSRAHGDADVGGLQGRGIVDAVSGHGDHLAHLVQLTHNVLLLLGHGTGKDDLLMAEHALPVVGVKGIHLSTVHHDGLVVILRHLLAVEL